MSSFFLLSISGFIRISIDTVGGPNNFFRRRSNVVYSTLYRDITEEEKRIIRNLFKCGVYERKSLFLQLFEPDVRSIIENYGQRPYTRVDELFYRALTMSMLLMKIRIQIKYNKWRFSLKSLSESILENYSDTKNKKDFVRVLENDLKKYNKAQSRLYMRHTIKNDMYFVIYSLYNKNYSKQLAHERYILEIEYYLKKERRKHSKYYELQEEINKYALKRIHDVPGWEKLTIEKLNELRETYSYLRTFFLKGSSDKDKIPKCCYENYLECFQLIYKFVERYTPCKLRDLAYFTLDYTYSIYSYYFLIAFPNGKYDSLILNDNIIPFEGRIYYEKFLEQCEFAINKIVLFIINDLQGSCNKVDNISVDLIMTQFSRYLEKLVYFPSYSIPKIEKATNKLSLDGLIVYNLLWNDYIMVTQSKFMEDFLSIAKKKDENFGILLLSFELIGIDFSLEVNRKKYTEIVNMILNAKREIQISVLINYLLRMIYKERRYQMMDNVTVEAMKNDINLPIQRKLEGQLSILNECKNRLENYISIAIGRDDHDRWKKGEAQNLIYQFIYRNYYGLEKPDILPGLLTKNKEMVKRFLKKYDLKIYDVIDCNNCSWYKIALENLKKDSEAYRNYEQYKKVYNPDGYKKLIYHK